MSTTTQILFNSPALHSLKRDQLVKLCKIHSIKASGKNVELIDKLKKHAETLPRDSPLSVAARGEGTTGEDVHVDDGGADETMEDSQATEAEQSQASNAQWGFQMPRPSEQWEVVMESIEESEERSSQGTLGSMRTIGSNNGGSGEFGTGMSKSSSMSSSIKALASSFGLRRGNASKSTLASSSSFPSSSSSKSMLYLSSLPPKNDELAQHSTPYSSIPQADNPPQSDHFTFDHLTQRADGLSPTEPPSPLPGHSLRPGVPVPANARLSLGLNAPATPTRKDQPTTTIRLISNPVSHDDTHSYGRTPQLKPFKTSFDLVLGSPQPTTGGFRGMDTDHDDAPLPGSLPSAPKFKPAAPRTPGPTAAASTHLAAPEPFVFGSPLPQHNVSNAQFKSAAASVLEEMNKRLQGEGVAGVGMDLIGRLQLGAHTQGVGTLGPREAKGTPKEGSGHKEKFDEIHAEEFSKMEGIDALVKRRGMKDAGAGAGAGAGKKRKSSVLGHGAGRDRYGRRIGGDAASGRISATRVISSGRRPRVLPGSFGDDDSEDEEGGEAEDGKRAKLDPSAMVEVAKQEDAAKAQEEQEKAKAEEEEQRRKEKEAIRRKLELNKARRRSSVGVAGGARGRVSIGRGGVLLKPQPPSKPSRFGFLSSAKSLVQKVWGGGKTSQVATGASGIPKPATKPSKAAPVPAAPPAPAQKKAPLIGNARPSTAIDPPASRVSSLRVDRDKVTATMTSTTSSRSRSPLPSFGPVSSTRSSLVRPSRSSSITGTGASSKSGAAVSSIGTRSSFASSNKVPSLGGVGSMGARKLSTGPMGRTSTSNATATGSSSSRLSSRLSSSRLLAPTASSLAKARPSASGSGTSLRTVAEGAGIQQSQGGDALGMITNDPGMAAQGPGPWSPRPGGIFSKPLTMPSGIPTPVKKRPPFEAFALTAGMPDQNQHGAAEDMSGVKDAGPSTSVLPIRQRSMTGRKPRISRSKVIAKLASQRATAGVGMGGPPGGTPSARGGRTRSSLGVKAQRSSFGGKAGGGKTAGDGVVMSAKKRARQSEYARRKSRVAPIDFGGGAGAGGQGMEVDGE
ncbi:hypothetical protein FPV67DRAFT_1422044 [Lyophyllum atratum]|nr:hypothetical protein FPV67DRAFT_1422044 [Lyophyllum atratum]